MQGGQGTLYFHLSVKLSGAHSLNASVPFTQTMPHPEQGALPGAVLTHDHGAAPGGDLKGELPDQRRAIRCVERDPVAFEGVPS